jgi:hypothetical protein
VRFRLIPLIPLIALPFLTAAYALTPVAFTGRGLDPETGELLYTEDHEDTLDREGGNLIAGRTMFRDPRGTLIAYRTVAYAASPWKPSYHMRDLRDGYEEGVEPLAGGKVRVFRRHERGKPLKEKLLTVPEPSVVDGGVNRFIRDHWTPLTAGRLLAFNFVAPARLDYFVFEVYLDSAVPPAGNRSRTFVVRPANAALRLLVAPIRVTYDAETRRIRAYSGLSNISDARGKNQQVRIVYPGTGP